MSGGVDTYILAYGDVTGELEELCRLLGVTVVR